MRFSTPEDSEEQEQVSGLNTLIAQMPLGRPGLPQYGPPACLSRIGISQQIRVQMSTMSAANSATGEVPGNLSEPSFAERYIIIPNSGPGIGNGQHAQGTIR
jgi:hypothetical protein